jgi:hypothetical protein
MSTTNPRYDEDVYGWAIHTAELLRSKKMDEVDFDNIIEEMEALGRSEKYELINRLKILISHLLKLQYQSTMTFKFHGWKCTIREQRKQAKNVLRDNPSLKSKLDEVLEDAYDVAISMAERETGLKEGTFPKECPYSFEEIMSDEFYPEAQ